MTVIQKGFKKITNILSKEQTEILETALLSMVPVMLNKVLGFVFGLIAASIFGNVALDWQHFLLANTIPDLLTNVIIAGSIGAIVIPTLITCARENEMEDFFRLFSSILNIAIIALSFISLLIAVFGDFIFPLMLTHVIHVSPEQYPSPTEMQSIINMMRVLLLPQIILGVSSFISSGLNVYNRFLIPQLAPLFFNVGRIFGILILYPIFGIWGLVWGVVVGAVMHLLIQLPLAKAVGLRYRLAFDIKSKHFKEIVRVGIPRFISLAFDNIGVTLTSVIAFGIKGGISALNFASQIITFIPSVFAFTFVTASFPKLSQYFADKNFDKFRYTVIKTLNEILFLVFPIVVAILVLRVPITRLVFGSMPGTRLELEDTYQIAWVIMLSGIGVIFTCGEWFLYRVFYSAKNTRTPLFTSVISFIIAIACSALFTNLFSHNTDYALTSTNITIENFFTRGESRVAVGGVALGMSIGYIVEFFLLLFLFNKNTLNLNLKELFKTIGKKVIAGGVMFVVTYGIYRLWNVLTYVLPDRGSGGVSGSTTLNLLILTIITLGTATLVYYLVCLLLGVEELKILKRYLNPVLRVGGVRIK